MVAQTFNQRDLGAAAVKVSVLAILVMSLASCFPVINHGYYAPSAATGSLEKYPYGSQCAGPKRVIRFPVNEDKNVALTVYAEQPVPLRPTTKVYVAVTYFDHKKGKPPAHIFHASDDRILVVTENGKKQVFSRELTTQEQVLDSIYEYSALATLKLSKQRLSSFSVKIPPLFFDGHKLEIPQVHFEYKTTSYISAINC